MNVFPHTVHIVDDDDAVRISLLRSLVAAGYSACGYSSATDFLQAAELDAGGCIILDVRMPGLDGLELQDVLAGRGIMLPIIFLTGHGDIAMSVRAIKAGAEDFLTKPVDRDALLSAVQRAIEWERSSRDQSARVQALKALFSSLTRREQQVFWQVAAGKLNKQVGAELGIAERTVKLYRHNAMVKLQATSLAQLVRMADLLRSQGSPAGKPMVSAAASR
jgi:FixJ family two-component response regulator